MSQIEKLRQYNRWRRGEEDWSPDERGPNPNELGELIDGAADRLEVLEREHAEFFESWHDERRKREALELAAKNLISVKGRHHTEQAYKLLQEAVEKVGTLPESQRDAKSS